MKGSAAAVIQKIQRNIDGMEQNIAKGIEIFELGAVTQYTTVLESHSEWLSALEEVDVLQIEGAQGYSLGINSGFYPYTTSRECTVQQLLVDCGLPFHSPYVYGVCRTFPIRVANRYAEDGKQIGWSGPFYPGSEELSWTDIGVEPELTTVTQLPRRVGTWSQDQVVEACKMNNVDEVFINFANYVDDPELLKQMVYSLDYSLPDNCRVSMLGYGPKCSDIMPISDIVAE